MSAKSKCLACTAIFISVFGSFSCQKNSTEENGKATESFQQKDLNRDSLRRVYQEKILQLSNPLPTQRAIEKNKVYPVDEGPLDTMFFLFRESLLETIARRDVLKLLDACDKNIVSDFGGEGRLSEFVEKWQLDKNAENSAVWATLEKILGNGGLFAKNRRLFSAPYTYAAFPEEVTTSEAGLIAGEGVRLRKSPATNASIITNLSYDIVELLADEKTVFQTIAGENHPWVKIKTIDGREGFIYGKYIVSPSDYRAGFELKANGKWQIIFLVEGD